MQDRQRLMMDEIVKGVDELGVLLMGNPKGVYWYGSRLTIDEAGAFSTPTTTRPRFRSRSPCWPA